MAGNKSDPNPEEAAQLALMKTPLGVPGSGYVRYAAAMHCYKNGLVCADLLEAYRICCKLDGEDPMAVFRQLGGARS